MLLMTQETLQPDDQEFILCIYEQFKRIMFSTAKKYVADITVVEDLVQDAIVKLLSKISTLRRLSQGSLSAYIVITVRNISINYLKHQNIVDHHCADSEFNYDDTEYQPYTPSPEEILLINEKKNEFRKVFDLLPDKDQDVLRGKYILGLTDMELAELYGCKVNSIRMVLTRARRNALAVMTEEFGYDKV